VIPVFVLPLLVDLATFGWSAVRQFGRLARSWRYWVLTPALLLGALWLPFVLLGWVPEVPGFALQMASFLVRLAVGYALFNGCWLLLGYVSSRIRREVQ
jgi:hypothetical protein